MASVEAIEALTESVESWEHYRALHQELIDLSFAVLEYKDLSDRTFERCDLTGAQLNNSHLDRAIIRQSRLSGATFNNTSAIEAIIEDITASGMTFLHAVLRNVSVRRCRLTKVSVKDSLLEQTTLTNCSLESFAFSDTKISDCRFERCKGSEWECSGGRMELSAFLDAELAGYKACHQYITDCRFDSCEIRGMSLDQCTLGKTAMKSSTINEYSACSSNVSDLDLSRSILTHVSVQDIGPATATLLETAFVSCDWPSQKGTTNILGSYSPSPHLLRHPVQDINCIGPILRREIADAQFLREKFNGAKSLPSAIGLRLWGFTSAYGQSIGRLSAICLGVILLHGLVLIAGNQKRLLLVAHRSPKCAIVAAGKDFELAGKSFIGLGVQGNLGSNFVKLTLISSRLCGFIALGIWISIASNMISKLSSE